MIMTIVSRLINCISGNVGIFANVMTLASSCHVELPREIQEIPGRCQKILCSEILQSQGREFWDRRVPTCARCANLGILEFQIWEV